MESSIRLDGPHPVQDSAPPDLAGVGGSGGTWDAVEEFLARQSELHFHQSLGWYGCGAGASAFFYVTMRDNRVIAVSLVRTRQIPGTGRCVYRIERGPIAETEGDLDVHLRRMVADLGHDAALVAVSPHYHGARGEAYAGVLKSGGWKPMPRILSNYQATIVVNLTEDIELIRGNLRRSLRTQLNRGGRLGIQIREASDASAIKTFVEQHDAMAHRRRLAPIPSEVTRCLSDRSGIAGPVMRLLVAEYEGQQIAGILLVCTGDRAIYEWGVTSEEERHRQLPLSHMLHWEAIMWAKAAGYHYYDFGGYWEERGDQDPINRFKTGFSKDVQRFVPEYYYPVRPLFTAALLRLARLRARILS